MPRPLIACLAIVSFVLFTNTAFCADKAKGDSKADKGASDLSAQIQKLLELHNAERAKEGAPPLKLNDELTKAAQDYAEFLVKENKFGHTEDGTVGSRLKKAGYKAHHASGENIAKGQKNPDAVVNAWMHSDGHRKNILSKSYKEVGFGIMKAKNGSIMWVTDFGG